MLEVGLSLLVLAIPALLGGGFVMWRRGERQRALLMAALALVMALNLAIWTLPTPGGGSLVAAATH